MVHYHFIYKSKYDVTICCEKDEDVWAELEADGFVISELELIS